MSDSPGHSDFVVGSDSSRSVRFSSMSEDSFDGSKNVSRSSNETSVSSHDGVIMAFSESVSAHNAEHFVDHRVVVYSSVVDDGVEAVNKLHVVDKPVHITLSEVDMTF